MIPAGRCPALALYAVFVHDPFCFNLHSTHRCLPLDLCSTLYLSLRAQICCFLCWTPHIPCFGHGFLSHALPIFVFETSKQKEVALAEWHLIDYACRTHTVKLVIGSVSTWTWNVENGYFSWITWIKWSPGYKDCFLLVTWVLVTWVLVAWVLVTWVVILKSIHKVLVEFLFFDPQLVHIIFDFSFTILFLVHK